MAHKGIRFHRNKTCNKLQTRGNSHPRIQKSIMNKPPEFNLQTEKKLQRAPCRRLFRKLISISSYWENNDIFVGLGDTASIVLVTLTRKKRPLLNHTPQHCVIK